MDASKPVVRTINLVLQDDKLNAMYTVEPSPGVPIIMEEGIETTWLLLDEGRFRDQAIRTSVSDHEYYAPPLDEGETRWNSWVSCLNAKVDDLHYLHRNRDQLPEIHNWKPLTDPVRMSDSCGPWRTSSHEPFQRSSYFMHQADD
ncbi:hypothetical protein ONZ45_g19724 [Pleurotus djamor]|nr:hypothetical protein ONZ45_g19724 [Pleurotus djamor]